MKSLRRKAGLPQSGPPETAAASEADELLAGRLGTMPQLQTATKSEPDRTLVDRPAQEGQLEAATIGEPDETSVARLGRIRRLPGGLRKIGRLPVGALRKTPRLLIGLVVAILVVLVAVLSGTVEETDRTLVIMGFDPDRAQLIAALIVAAVAAVAVTLATDRPAIGALLGTWAMVALFGETFTAETHNALSATGALGSFDLIGWIVTLVTLVVMSFISAWAGATLAAAIRPSLVATGASVREMVEARRPNRRAAHRPVAAALILGLLVVTVPAFGDMVNLAPDALMLNGGHFVALAPDYSIPVESTTPSPLETPTPTPASSATPSSQLATPSPTPSPTPHASPSTKPWLAWKPTGNGHVTPVRFPAPWTGGTLDTVDINVYTPPGYDPEGDRLYPVLYEAPTGLELWNSGTGVIGALDQLIDSGAMPAALVVFIDSQGATFPDSQCADSTDKRMWLETFISVDVVQYVDFAFHTIRDPIARGIMGQSAGGFCAAMLLSRHPDVFSTSISFSGYFYAGIGSGSAPRPYGNSQAEMDKVSPALLVPRLSDEEKARSFFIIVASPTQELFGPQAQNFEKILAKNHIGYDAVKSIWVHSWTQIRNEFPPAVEAWAARMVVDGVW
ncbi:MAG: alpha/beta hydrolase-fold protein [Candidatus Limnocylindrales bacterium]